MAGEIAAGGPDDDVRSYPGIAGTSAGFAVAFTVARPLAAAGATDIAYAEVGS